MDLNLDDVDLDGVNLDDMDLSDFGEVNETVDFPHIKIGSKAFKEFLKVAKKVCASGGKDIISKAVCLKYDKDKEKVIGYATDFDVYIEQELECLNTDNILEEAIVVPTDILIKLCSAVPSNTIIYKNEDTMVIRLYGGDMQLETHSMSVEKFQFADATTRVGSVEATPLYGILKDFSPVVSAAVNPAEKRIVVSKDGAYANYMFAILKSDGITGEYDLKSKDIEVLKALTVNKKDETLNVYKTAEDVKASRCVIEANDFKYAFLISESTMSDTLKNNMAKVINENGVFVDFIQLYKMIELASELPYALGKVGINYSDDGICVDVKTKKGASNIFNISGSIEGDIKPLDKELVVQAKLLRILLRSFASKQSIRLSVSSDGLGVSCDDYSSAIYSEAE